MGNFLRSFLRDIWSSETPFFSGLFLVVVVILTCVAYVLVCDALRSIFRKNEQDIALVTLNISFYPGLLFFILTSIFVAIQHSNSFGLSLWLGSPLLAGIICVGMYWCIRLFKQVFVYYLKEYSETTEVMWDEVLIPLLEGIVPTVIIIFGISAILQFCFHINLAGIWVTLGGGHLLLV
jgi:MscS family membrane protein